MLLARCASARATSGCFAGPGEPDAGACLGDVLVDVGVCAPAGDLGDFGVAVAGDQEGEVGALTLGKAGEDLQGVVCGEDVVDRVVVAGYGLPLSRGRHRLEMKVAALARAEAVGLADGDDVQPCAD